MILSFLNFVPSVFGTVHGVDRRHGQWLTLVLLRCTEPYDISNSAPKELVGMNYPVCLADDVFISFLLSFLL